MNDLKRFAFKEGFGKNRGDYLRNFNISYVKMTHEWQEDTKDRVGDIWWSGSFNGLITKNDNGYHDIFKKDGDKYIKIGVIDNYCKLKALKETLLSFGGDNVCFATGEPDIDDIINRGQFWLAKKGRIKRMTGEKGQCHRNSCRLYERNKNDFDIRICTGYALASDGLWRQHSWLVAILNGKPKIIETTVKWGAYYGFIMTPQECDDFVSDCI